MSLPTETVSSLPADFDADAFAAELDQLRARVRAELDEGDLLHLRKIERWGRAAGALGWSLAWLAPNPISVLGLAQARTTRWTMVAHHVMHRGYDRVPGVPASRTTCLSIIAFLT